MPENVIEPGQFDRLADFVFKCGPQVPKTALEMASILLIDTLGVAAGGANLQSGIIARNHAVEFHGYSDEKHAAPILFDGRKASIPGAAFASATQIDNLDGHDGYNPTKGHIGCAVVPALFAFAHAHPELSGRDALAALVMSYELAARAAISLHATVSDYHTSGAWNALGVAALGCRLRGRTKEQLRQALGIAEYHGPRSQMMREIANPTMLHDGSGMGALTGTSACLLAERGFIGAPAITIEGSDVKSFWQDLGSRWTIEKNYIKPYPICRWAHAAIDAVRQLKIEHKFTASEVKTIEVRTFKEAACLYQGMPETTSMAQYSLPFAVATMLEYEQIAPEHVSGDGLKDGKVAALLRRIKVVEERRHSERFPEGRWSNVHLELTDGTTLSSGDVHARGGPEAPMDDAEIKAKFLNMTATTLSAERSEKIWSMRERLLAPDAKLKELGDLVIGAGDYE